MTDLAIHNQELRARRIGRPVTSAAWLCDGELVKRCSTCRETLPATRFGADRHAPDGLRYACRDCVKAHDARRYTPRPRKPAPTPDPTRMAARFWAKVEKLPSGCWEYRGAKTKSGYGYFFLSKREGQRMDYAHRVAYRLVVGLIPEGLVLDHLCRNRGCVNPAHLEPVTHAQNVWRGEAPSLVIARSGVCARGHVKDYVSPQGQRRCRVCDATAAARRYERKRSAA